MADTHKILKDTYDSQVQNVILCYCQARERGASVWTLIFLSFKIFYVHMNKKKHNKSPIIINVNNN